MEEIKLIKTDKNIFYHNDNKLYSLSLKTYDIFRQSSDYSIDKWNEYVNRVLEDKIGSFYISDDILIDKFNQKSKELDTNIRPILKWNEIKDIVSSY